MSEIMGLENRITPDSGNPNDNNDEITPNMDLIINNNDSDTEEEELIYNAYEPVPTNDYRDDSDNEEDEIAASAEPVDKSANDSLPPITPIESTLVKEVWSAPVPKEVDIVMDTNKVNEVKQAMINITLPPSAIPEWASNIPEEEWKQQLIMRLKGMNK